MLAGGMVKNMGILVQDNHPPGSKRFAHGISHRALLARWRGRRDGSGVCSCRHPSPEQPPAQQGNEAENHVPEGERDHHLVGEGALRLKLHRGHVVAVQRPRLVALRGRQGARGHQQLQDAVPLCRWQGASDP